jgi:hypothetical protein
MLFLEIAVFLQGGLLGIPFLTRVETPVCGVRASVSREGSHSISLLLAWPWCLRGLALALWFAAGNDERANGNH